MRSLPASELLATWESGLVQRPIERALTLLSATSPETSLDDLANLSVGQRDACLLALREKIFGSQLVGLANCPKCDERLEFSFNVTDMRAMSEANPPATLSLNVESYDVRFRLPSSFDLLAISDSPDVVSGKQKLLERCVLDIDYQGDRKAADELPESVVQRVIGRMSEADPQADVQLALSCPLCGHSWQSAFDIASFLWTEINAWAHRTLHDVHRLATAYGWRESEILALSPLRRQVYLEMANR